MKNAQDAVMITYFYTLLTRQEMFSTIKQHVDGQGISVEMSQLEKSLL